ncbi:hypothetical protein L484_001484 [Morus notabilis]|uniref:B3 domain-containing protein n=1 Tax=Morus notabilis TaxID=981085 RepID=W9RUN8_9ROSA|nr:B3 domain-containing protein At2g24670 [Morus notabilis]XP_010097996.1 B3 domain-containing protein At2g24670 [Morus notabilis]EXB37466.1 hypothetical protein L484_002566 [Morus notabilis]EXB74314.1 hypothetical protein L484_001484 [Morus notabilis]
MADHFSYMVELCLKIAESEEEHPIPIDDHDPTFPKKPTRKKISPKNTTNYLPNLMDNLSINAGQGSAKNDMKSASTAPYFTTPKKIKVQYVDTPVLENKTNLEIDDVSPGERKRERKKAARSHLSDIKTDQKENSGTTKKKKVERKPTKTVVIDGPNPPPGMPENLRALVVKLQGRDGADDHDHHQAAARLILQKQLYQSDLEPQQSRLSMPLKKLGSDDFLSEEEKTEIAKNTKGFDVKVIEPCSELDITTMHLRKWDYNTSSSYVLTNKWINVVRNHKLVPKEIIQIWFFRDKNQMPCFALVILGRE